MTSTCSIFDFYTIIYVLHDQNQYIIKSLNFNIDTITQHLYNCHNHTILLHSRMIVKHSCTIVALCDDAQHKPTIKIWSLSSYTNVQSSRHVHCPLLLQYSHEMIPGSLVPSLCHHRRGSTAVWSWCMPYVRYQPSKQYQGGVKWPFWVIC